MKKLLLLLASIAMSQLSNAQTPQAIPYQAAARNSSGTILASTPVSVRFSIHDATADGTVVYSETHSVTTTAQGMFSVNVGQGTPVTGTFSGINWGTNAKYMQVELDPAGGSSYIDMGTQQMMSVPYALHAGTSSSSSQWTTSGSNIHNANTGNVGIGTSAPAARLQVADSSVVFTGPEWYLLEYGEAYGYSPGNPPISGSGSRMMWYADKAAFRVGSVGGDNWDKDSVGLYSFACGHNTIASGENSFASGRMSTASGSYSTAMGGGHASGLNSLATAASTATGINSVAMGSGMASGDYSIAMGGGHASGVNSLSIGLGNAIGLNSFSTGYANSVGENSTAMGYGTYANGENSTAMGFNTNASGENSLAIGDYTTASGENSFAMGKYSAASGRYSTAMGTSGANGDYSTAIGSSAANGDYSTAMGQATSAAGQASTAMGYFSNAFGDYSTAMGYYAVTFGNNSTAMGSATTASGAFSTAIGNYVSTNEKNGSFSIGDNSTTTYTNNDANNRMMMRFAGGYKLYNDTFATKGLEITSSGSAKYMSNVTATFTDRSLVDKHYVDSVAVGGSSTGWAASGTNIHNTNTGKVGIGTSTPAARLQVADSSVVFTANGDISGTYGNTPVSGSGRRMMWYADKAAFRAGYVSGANWDNDSIGNYSVAMGRNTSAKGISSTALGASTSASGNGSIACGDSSIASGYSAVSLGNLTTASGDNAIALGYNTTANGSRSFAMGSGAISSGSYSFALGTAVNSSHIGSFVLGDASAGTFTNSIATGDMTMRFSGGYRLFTNISSTVGVSLPAGGNSWATISDRNKKENFAAVDGEAFLRKIAKFNLTSWNYKGQDPATHRHYGPMAQDFYAAFGKDQYGTIGNDTTISQADMEGVSFIAIQALVKENEAMKAKIKQLENKNSTLNNELNVLKAELTTNLQETNNRMQEIEKLLRKKNTASK